MRHVVTLTLLATALTGCGRDTAGSEPDDELRASPAARSSSSPHAPTMAECVQRVRYRGEVYDGIGLTSRAANAIGTADRSRCSDVGRNAKGPFFPTDPRSARTYSLERVPPSTAVAVAEGGSYGVYVSAEVPQREAERLLDRIKRLAAP